MIMDEVLAVGDMAFQKKCLDKMREAAQKEGRTVLYVSHNMNTIRQLCDRCVVLDKGKVVFEGGVEEAIEVYMGTAVNLSCKYQYSFQEHTNKGTKDLWIESLIIPGKELNQAQADSVIEMVLGCEVRKPVNNVEFRFEVQYADGSVAGTAFSIRSVSFNVTGKTKVHISFDTSHLAPGRYKADLVAYSTDLLGNDIYIDGVIPAMFFEVVESNGMATWLHKYWGHTRLHDVTLNII